MDVEETEDVDEGLEWLEVANEETEDEDEERDKAGGNCCWCWRLEPIPEGAVAKAGMGGESLVGVEGTGECDRAERGV